VKLETGHLPDGFSVLSDVFAESEIELLVQALTTINADGAYAIRNLLNLSPEINALARSSRMCTLAEEFLGRPAFPVRAMLFDKTPSANWLVPWHQDLTICVASRVDVPGYGPWTRKAGVLHVQPPVPILESMISVRIHLDDCDASHGALRVLPRTHKSGRLTTEQIAEQQRLKTPVCCEVQQRGVVLMKPLLLHSSSAALKPAHRRVIHIDYASSHLHGGLQWHTTASGDTALDPD